VFKKCVNGMGFRGIETVTGVHHTTVIYWSSKSRKFNTHEPDSIPEVGEL